VPRILEKAYAAGYRTLLVAGSEENAALLNQSLWSYTPNSFLPHGTRQDGQPEHQPIFISPGLEPAPNQANLLFVTDGSEPEKTEDYSRILDIFNGHDEEAVAAARHRWKRYKEAGHPVSYFSQKPDGAWEQKAA
jgi:DNA polymerase-3 subunit chi